MRKLILSLAAAAVALGAAPAFAQGYGAQDYGRDWRGGDRGYDRGYERGYADPDRQIWMLQSRVQNSVESGRLSRHEANYFLAQIADLRRLNWRFSRQGYNGWERRVIAQRVESLSARLRQVRDDGNYGRDYWRR